MERKGEWLITFTGKKFWPCDPRPEEIDITDIAHHLSLICRFTGASKCFYCVGDHSIRASEIVPKKDALWGLLHDASEAYIADVSRPVKPFLNNYQALEEQLMGAVSIRFGLPWPMPDSIHHADDVLVLTERRDLLAHGPDWGEWTRGIELLEEPIMPRTPKQTEKDFLSRFDLLMTERGCHG